MLLQSLLLKNFRNHDHLEVAFDAHLTCIVGENGSGKTSILEALHFLSTGKSFRTNQLTELIFHGATSFYIEAAFVKEDVSQTIKVGYDGTKKIIALNASYLPAFSHLLGILPSVMYAPKDIGLIMGSPIERRRFLNIFLGQSDPLYSRHLLRYTKALEHRNALLKAKKIYPSEEISCFEKELAVSACYLMQERSKALLLLRNQLATLTEEIAKIRKQFEIDYLPSLKMSPDSNQIAEQYKKQRPKEILVGTTLLGPHRDDFTLSMDGRPAKAFCSEGQKRVLLSALKIAEWELLKTQCGTTPLLCVDDIGIHLDQKRELLLEERIQHLGQVIMTSPHAPHICKTTFAIPTKAVSML